MLDSVIPKYSKQPKKIINLDKNNISVYIYGEPMVGKTTLADTFPNPIIFSTDGNTQNTTSPVVNLFEMPYKFKNLKKATAEYGETNNRWEAFCRRMKNIIDNKQELINKGFKTIVIDTIDQVYQWNEEHQLNKLNLTVIPTNDFGKAGRFIKEKFLIQFRPILDQLSQNFNVVLIGHEYADLNFDDKSVKYEPFLKSMFKSKTTNFKEFTSKINMLGFLKIEKIKNPKGEEKNVRVLVVENYEESLAMNRFNLSKPISDPTYKKIIEQVKEQNNAK